MEKDPILEEISDRIRMGVPVSLSEGIAAIDYQDRLREHRNITRRSTLTGKAGRIWGLLKFMVRFPGK